MLAYVFWHWPRPGVDGHDYRERLARFHRALASSAPAGFHGSRAFDVGAVPGIATASGLVEDWYFVDDFAALGVINEAAVAAHTREPHDAAASFAAGGTAGIYKLCSPRVPDPRSAAWFAKPANTSYAAFFATVPAGAELWQRQMTLGPAPEFCALGSSAGDLAAFVAPPAVTASPIRTILEERP
jgi:hypothetical protein